MLFAVFEMACMCSIVVLDVSVALFNNPNHRNLLETNIKTCLCVFVCILHSVGVKLPSSMADRNCCVFIQIYSYTFCTKFTNN